MKRENLRLRVFAALAEDINSGWIWLPEHINPDRSVIKIECRDTDKSVVCEALPLGDNFKERYNTSQRTFDISDPHDILVMNEWYRQKLDIHRTQQNYEFDIKPLKSLGRLRASHNHPQVIVRLGTNLGLIGIFLGSVSLILGLISIFIAFI